LGVWTDDVLGDVLREVRRRRHAGRRLRVVGAAAALLSGVALAAFVSVWAARVPAPGPEPAAAPVASQPAAPSPPVALPPLVDLLAEASPSVVPLREPAPSFVDLVLGSEAGPAEPDRTASAASPPSVIEGSLEPGDTLVGSLSRRGVDPATAALIAREMTSQFDFRRARPGQHYRLERDAAGALVSFHFQVSDREHYDLEPAADGEGWQTRVAKREVIHRTARLAGVVSTTLYDAVQDLGEDPELASAFANIFAWDVDFAKGVQPGDEFHVLYQRDYVHGSNGKLKYLGPGRILAARYKTGTQVYEAVYYGTSPGHGDYFRPDGSSVRQEFLAAPLKYTRISSSFTFARYHPILHITRPHPGIDYAAPIGTPIWSVASGRVAYAGWANGFGRLVKIEHANGYESYYGHLSRFASGLHVGQTVHQKQIIGYVGTSGLSTGPHVCFRITKDGRYVNPLSTRIPSGERIPADQRQAFTAVRDARLGQLGPPPIVATDEAM
jgi:murein DD-endopeptidase MepM/ murein hydrolase activator NlpD